MKVKTGVFGASVSCVSALVLASILASCAGQKAAPQPPLTPGTGPAQAGAFAGLPSPLSLLGGQAEAETKHISTSFTEADCIKNGMNFDAGLPNNRVAAASNALDMTPAWIGNGPHTLADAAYAVFRFNIPGYDRNGQARIHFDTEPGDYNNVWLALGNLDTNAWDWRGGQADYIYDFSSRYPYVSGSYDILVAVVVLGGDACTLGNVRVGGLPPFAVVTATPDHGDVILNTTLSAEQSDAVEGSIIKYEWDLGDDGVYEVDTGTTPTYDASFNLRGIYPVYVRVTNTAGARAEGFCIVWAIPFWKHTWGYLDADLASAFDTAPDGSLVVVGTMNDPAATKKHDIIVSKWDMFGELVWRKRYQTSDEEWANDVGVDGSGNIFVVGTQTVAGDAQALALKFAPDGSLLWQKRFGETGKDSGSGIVVTDAAVMVAGLTHYQAGLDADAQAVGLDPASGDIFWGTRINRSGDQIFNDFEVRRALLGAPDGAILAASVGNKDLEVFSINTSGGVETCFQAGYDPASSLAFGQILHIPSLFILPERFYIASVYSDATITGALLLSSSTSSGAATWAKRWEGLAGLQVRDMCFDHSGDLVVSSTYVVGGQPVLLLSRFARSDGATLGGEQWYDPGRATVGYDVGGYQGGLFVCGQARDIHTDWGAMPPSCVDHAISTTPFTADPKPLGWTAVDAAGISFDAGGGTYDDNSGLSDMLLVFRGDL